MQNVGGENGRVNLQKSSRMPRKMRPPGEDGDPDERAGERD